MKTFVIGDLHGNFYGLKQALNRSNFDYENDLLITLGDISDGYKDVFECIKELSKIKNRIDIKGNHDIYLEDWLEYGIIHPNWILNGGNGTIKEYLPLTKDKVSISLKFLKHQLNYYIDDKNRLFVHGGYSTMNGVVEESLYSLVWNRSLWNIALSGSVSQKIPKILRIYDTIFIGHTTTMIHKKYIPMNKCNVWNIDTGGGCGGKITIIDVNTKEYWQSDLAADLGYLHL